MLTLTQVKSILAETYFNNTVQDYLIAAGITLLGLALIKLFKRFILRSFIRISRRTKTRFDDFVVSSLERFGIPALYLAAVYAGVSYLNLTLKGTEILRVATTIAFTVLGIRLVSTIILKLLRRYVRRRTHDEEKVKQIGGLMLIINIFI